MALPMTVRYTSRKSDSTYLQLVIRPLLDNCMYGYFYVREGMEKRAAGWLENTDIFIKEKEKYKLDVSKECIKGHEDLWNGDRQGDGVMVIVMKDNLEIFEKIFENTLNTGGLGNPGAVLPASVVRKCNSEIKNGNIAVTFSGHCEGMELLIYAKRDHELHELAKNKCGNYVQMAKDILREYSQKTGKPLEKTTKLERQILAAYLSGMGSGLFTRLRLGSSFNPTGLCSLFPERVRGGCLGFWEKDEPIQETMRIGFKDYLLYENGQKEKVVENILKRIASLKEIGYYPASYHNWDVREKTRIEIFGKKHKLPVFTKIFMEYYDTFDCDVPDEEITELNKLIDSGLLNSDALENEIFNYINKIRVHFGMVELEAKDLWNDLRLARIATQKDGDKIKIFLTGELKETFPTVISITFLDNKFIAVDKKRFPKKKKLPTDIKNAEKLDWKMEDLWKGCILAGIAKAIAAARLLQVANDHSWDGINFRVQEGHGYGVVSFADGYCSGVFYDGIHETHAKSAFEYFENAPKRNIELAEEALWCLDISQDNSVTKITTAFWGDSDGLFINDSFDDFLKYGGDLLKIQFMDIESAINVWTEDYAFSEQEIKLLKSLYERKIANPKEIIKLTKKEISVLCFDDGDELDIECAASFKEIGIYS